MLRRADEHLTAQREFEAEAQARLEAARQKRQEEKQRQEALEVCYSSSPLDTVRSLTRSCCILLYLCVATEGKDGRAAYTG